MVGLVDFVKHTVKEAGVHVDEAKLPELTSKLAAEATRIAASEASTEVAASEASRRVAEASGVQATPKVKT